MSDVAPTVAPTVVPSTCDLKFVSSDNKEFLIPANAIKMSGTIKDMLVGLGLDNLEMTNADAIPLPNVDAKTLEKVITWCKHHIEHPEAPVDPSADPSQRELSEYASNYFKLEQTEIFEIILAANFLDIQCLLRAGCKKIADMMKGKTTEQLRAQFEIVNDFTAEEEEAIRKENAWCED